MNTNTNVVFLLLCLFVCEIHGVFLRPRPYTGIIKSNINIVSLLPRDNNNNPLNTNTNTNTNCNFLQNPRQSYHEFYDEDDPTTLKVVICEECVSPICMWAS